MDTVGGSTSHSAIKREPMDLPILPLKPDGEGQVQPRRVDELLSATDSPMSPLPTSMMASGIPMDFPEDQLEQNEAGLVIKFKNEKSGWQLSGAEGKQKGRKLSRKQKTGNDSSGMSTDEDVTTSDDENSLSNPSKDPFAAKRPQIKEEDVDFEGPEKKSPKKKLSSQEKPTKKVGEKRGRKPNSQIAAEGFKFESATNKRQRKNETDSDSDDNFEVLPFKRRQFRPELEDESANMFCPEKLESSSNSQNVGVTSFNITSNEQPRELLTPKMEPGSLGDESLGSGVEQPVKRKRGRPRKIQPTAPALNDNESSSSSSQGTFVKKYRSNRTSRSSFDLSDRDNSLSLEGSFDGSENERDNENENEVDKDDEDYENKYLKSKLKKKKGMGKKSAFGVAMPKKMNGKQKFRCKICDKVLSNYWAFEAHRATVHGKRTFVCDVCNKAFKRKDHLANHKRSIHVVRTKYCLLCDLKFNRKIELVAHIKTVHPDEYVSAKEFLPVESTSPSKGSLSPCEMTEDDFSNDGFGTMEDFDEDSNSNLSREESVEPSEKRKRGRPKKMHAEEDMVETEREMDHLLYCQTCATGIEESTMAEHEKMWHKPVSCNYCNEEFFGCSRVFDHMLSHVQVLNGKTFYKCAACMFRTLDIRDLDEHFAEVHLRHHCNACESCIKGRIQAEDHIIDKHKPVFNTNSTFFKCRECNEIFGALSEAQLHFLVHHFSKCECAKFPKVTSTCWQDWDEKLLEPEVARSTPQQTLHLTAITDSNQTNEIKPNPSFQKPYLRNACQACGVDMECYEDLIEHQAHHHRQLNGDLPLVPLNGKKKVSRAPTVMAQKSSPQVVGENQDLSSGVAISTGIVEGPVTSVMSSELQLTGKENEIAKLNAKAKGKKKQKKSPKKLIKKTKKTFQVSSFKRNLLQHLKSRKDHTYRDFFDDDDDDDDNMDEIDDSDHHGENYLPLGVPNHPNQFQSNDFLRRNLSQQYPVQSHGENRPTTTSGGKGQSSQQVATPAGQSSSGSGGSQSSTSGQSSGDSSAQTSQSSTSSNPSGGTNSGSDNPQEPFPNRTLDNQAGAGSCIVANSKSDPKRESEDSNVENTNDSPANELDFDALQNVSPNTLQRVAQGNEAEDLDNTFTSSVNELLESLLPENEHNAAKVPGSYDVVNWEDNGQFGSYLRRQNPALQDNREGELNTPVLDGLESSAAVEGASVPTPTATGDNAEVQSVEVKKSPESEQKQISEEQQSKASGPKATSTDPDSVGVSSSSDLVVNDIQFISTVFDNLSSPQRMDLLNIPGQQTSAEPIFDQEASDLLDNILEDAEASARGLRRSPMQIARDSNLFPPSSVQVGLQEPQIDQHHQMQHAVAAFQSPGHPCALTGQQIGQESFQHRANHQQAVLLQQRHNDLSGQSQGHPNQISLEHHQQGRPHRIYDSGMYFQQHHQSTLQQQQHQQQQFGLHFHDQRSQSIPSQRMMSQQQMMSSQDMPGGPYNIGYQRGQPMVRPQQSHPGYQQQYLSPRHSYPSNNPHIVGQHHQQLYDRNNAQANQDIQFQHQPSQQAHLYQSQHQQTLNQSMGTINRPMNFASHSDFSFSDRPTASAAAAAAATTNRQSFQGYPSAHHRMDPHSQQPFQTDMGQTIFNSQMPSASGYFRTRGNIQGNMMQPNEGNFPPPSKRPRQFDE